MVSLNKALLNPYFWGGYVRGGRLTSHEDSKENYAILGVQVLVDNMVLSDDDQTLECLGLLHTEWDVIMFYSSWFGPLALSYFPVSWLQALRL